MREGGRSHAYGALCSHDGSIAPMPMGAPLPCMGAQRSHGWEHPLPSMGAPPPMHGSDAPIHGSTPPMHGSTPSHGHGSDAPIMGAQRPILMGAALHPHGSAPPMHGSRAPMHMGAALPWHGSGVGSTALPCMGGSDCSHICSHVHRVICHPALPLALPDFFTARTACILENRGQHTLCARVGGEEIRQGQHGRGDGAPMHVRHFAPMLPCRSIKKIG